ncbi:MAG: hypothetical protein ACPGKS_05700, partial [Coraliomargarita sp.]
EEAPSVLEGVMLSRLTEELRDEFNVPDSVEGVAILDVSNESPYVDTLTKEMVIMEVNKTKVERPDEIEDLLKSGSNSFYVWALGQPRFVVVRLDE